MPSDKDSAVKCPFCAEYIKNEAIVCKHCGKEITEKIKKELERKKIIEELQKPKIDNSRTGKVICKECDFEYYVEFDIHNVAKFPCPRCKKDNKRKNTSQENNAKYLIIAVSLIVSLIILSMFRSCINKPSTVGEIDAYLAAQMFIEKKLKAPKTADFGDYRSDNVIKNGNRYTVRGYVDAENSFGAKIRTQFVCEVEYSRKNDEWRLIYSNMF